MTNIAEKENRTLIEFWNKAFSLSDDDKEKSLKDPGPANLSMT